MGLKGYRLWVMGQLDSTCRAPTLTPPDPQLKGARCPGGFNPRAYQARNPVSKFAFKWGSLRRYDAGSNCRSCWGDKIYVSYNKVGLYNFNSVDP
jgi:hypothetical protein